MNSPTNATPPKKRFWTTLFVQYFFTLLLVGGFEAVFLRDWRSLLWAVVLLAVLRLHAAFWQRIFSAKLYPFGLLIGYTIILLPLLVLHCAVWQYWLNPISISESTTFITQPRTQNGKRVDMFLALEQRMTPPNPPHENGFRIMAERFGPTFAFSSSYPVYPYYEPHWKQVCEKLQLNSNTDWDVEPKHVFRSFRELIQEIEEKKNQPPQNSDTAAEAYRDWEQDFAENVNKKADQIWSAREKPWTAEEFPEMELWLDEVNPFFDALGEAVRKPVYFEPFSRENENDTLEECFFKSSQSRRLAADLTIRVHYHLGRGEVEKAWYDTLTQFRFLYHEQRFSFHPNQIMVLHFRTTPLSVLKHGNLSPEQISRFREEIEPFLTPLDERILENQRFGVRLFALDYFLRWTYSDNWGPKYLDGIFAWNQALEKLNRGFDAAWNESLRKAASPHPTYNESCMGRRADPLAPVCVIRTFPWYGPCKWFPCIIADEVLDDTDPTDLFFFLCCPGQLQGYDQRFQTTQKAMIRLGFALAGHKVKNGEYPQTLNELPTPLIFDPFSPQQSFIYERKEDGSCRFYSVGSNGIDDNGVEDHEQNANDIAETLL